MNQSDNTPVPYSAQRHELSQRGLDLRTVDGSPSITDLADWIEQQFHTDLIRLVEERT
jgi:hypothetical protein